MTRRRTIALQGGNDDAGKWYRCWKCGVRCNIDRERIGNNSGQVATQYVELSDPYQAYAPNDPDKTDHNLRICCDTLGGHYETLCGEDAAGDPKKPYGGWKAEVSHGCWFCGCPTWKG